MTDYVHPLEKIMLDKGWTRQEIGEIFLYLLDFTVEELEEIVDTTNYDDPMHPEVVCGNALISYLQKYSQS